MNKLKQHLALSERLLESAEIATSTLHRDAMRTAAHIIQTGGRVPPDIVDIVKASLSFSQNRYGK